MLPSLSVVVPVYKSAASLPALIERLEPVLAAHARTYEVLLVNDNSPDESWKVIGELAKQNNWVQGVDLMRNYGQHNALLCGIRAARGEIIVTMDDDLQHPPEEIPKLLEKLAEGHDVVYGTPISLSHAAHRNFTSRFTKWLLASAMGVKNIKGISAFRAFRTDLRLAFQDYHSPELLIDVLLSWGTTRFSTVAVQHDPRRIGSSNYNFFKLLNQALLILTGFSTAPLHIATIIGFVFTVLGIVIFIYVIAQFLHAGSVPGFPFLASTIALFSGAQLFALGILGEYLARIFKRSMERPTYVIRQKIEDKSQL